MNFAKISFGPAPWVYIQSKNGWFSLHFKDYDILINAIKKAQVIDKKSLDTKMGPIVFIQYLFLPNSFNEFVISIVIERTCFGYQERVKVHPLCNCGVPLTHFPKNRKRRKCLIDLGFNFARSDIPKTVPQSWKNENCHWHSCLF